MGLRHLPSGSWQARYTDDTGKRHSRSFKSKRAAEDWLIEQKRALLHGEHVAPSDARRLFSDFIDEWWATTVHLRPGTRQSYGSLVEHRIRPRFGMMEIGRINQPMVKRWVSEMTKEGLSPSTVHKAVVVLGSIMRAAQDAGLIARLPTTRVKKPAGETKAEMRFLVPDEIKLLAETIDPRYRALVFFGAYCGLRIGEIFALRRENLDLFRGIARVEATMTEIGELRPAPPKTKAARRSVPIPKHVRRELSEHLKRFVPADEPFVFPAVRGGPQGSNNFRRRVWTPAVEKAGLAPLRIHDLRHTAISLWLAAGDDPVTVARRAGHTSTVTVMDVYGHLMPGRGEESMNRLDAVFEAAKTPEIAKVVPFPKGRS